MSDKNNEISITITYPVTIKESDVINFYKETDENKVIELFKKAKEDKITTDELEDLKDIIKDAADKIFETSSMCPIIHQSDLDILID